MLLSYTAVEFMQRFRFSSEQGALISALGSATGGGPVPTIQLVWESGAEGIAPSICGTLIREHQKFPGFPSPSGDEKYRSATVFHHSIGNFHYLTGMEDVWLGGRHYDLREHKRARLCLICMAEANAVDEKSALHFLEEIDPYVRAQGKIDPLGKYSNIKIQDYFRDPTNEITSLGQLLIKAVGGNGKDYLDAGVG